MIGDRPAKGVAMFVSKRNLTAMQARIGELERHVERLTRELQLVQPLLTEAARLDAVAERTAQLAGTAEAALRELQRRADDGGVARPRFDVELGRVYQAEVTGYIAAYAGGGYTDVVEILVGPTSPPGQRVGRANTMNDINSYAGAVVRAGEYWVVSTERGADKSSFTCVFTPL
jgi:hypothetical protein